jgi:hypothetical protein
MSYLRILPANSTAEEQHRLAFFQTLFSIKNQFLTNTIYIGILLRDLKKIFDIIDLSLLK